MILFCYLNLGKKIPVELESCRQVVKGLLEVAILEIGLSELGVCRDENKKVLLVNVNEQLAESELLNAHLYDPVSILRHGELV